MLKVYHFTSIAFAWHCQHFRSMNEDKIDFDWLIFAWHYPRQYMSKSSEGQWDKLRRVMYWNNREKVFLSTFIGHVVISCLRAKRNFFHCFHTWCWNIRKTWWIHVKVKAFALDSSIFNCKNLFEHAWWVPILLLWIEQELLNELSSHSALTLN